MSFLKGLAVGLLSLLLFFSLSVFGLVFTLNQTVLKPEFLSSHLERLDLSSLTHELLSEQIPQNQSQALINEAFDATVADLEPWAKQQAGVVILALYDYLDGTIQALNVSISLQPVKDSIKKNIRQVVLSQPLPPELSGIPPEMLAPFIDAYIDQYYQQIAGELPATFDIDASTLGPEGVKQLEQARQIFSWVKIGTPLLLGFMVLLILLIFLVSRDIRGTSRNLGVTFLLYGVLGFVSVVLWNRLSPDLFGAFRLPSAIEAWLPQLTSDLAAPMQTLSIALGIVGIVLIVVSIVYPRKAAD